MDIYKANLKDFTIIFYNEKNINSIFKQFVYGYSEHILVIENCINNIFK